jgi:hypothetical protein
MVGEKNAHLKDFDYLYLTEVKRMGRKREGIDSKTHWLMCLGIIGPSVVQKCCKLGCGANEKALVCRIRQTAEVNAKDVYVGLNGVSAHRVDAVEAGKWPSYL